MLDIHPQYLPLSKLLDGRLFRIPEYQRAYSWTSNQRRDLFEDIERVHSKGPKGGHFMAAVVCLRRKKLILGTNEFQELDIVDGQQRITTLIVLLNSIKLALNSDKESEEKLARELRELLVKVEGKELLLLQTNHDSSHHFATFLREGTAETSDGAKTVADSVVAWIIPKDALSWCFSTQGITWMPHKFNAARRHKFDKAQYRVINWAEYNESLRQRGDLTIWVSDEAQSVWSAPRRTSRGGQRRYSDLAIETCLTLRTAYRLGLRQTQGLMGSIGTLMGLDIRVPDYSTLSRRANGLSIAQAVRQAGSVPVHRVVDSTGLKIFGEGEWLAQKHKTRGIRRRWRKLHLGLDLASGAIVCANLTHEDVGDSTALPGLLDQLDAPVTGFLADGAYDGASTRDLLRERYGETLDVVIPPPKNAVIRPQSARDPTVRDRHIAQIRSNGRMAWQVATGYNQRSRIETQIGRWKSVSSAPELKSRSFSRQITEIQVGQKVLNTMTALGRPVFERIA